MAVDDPLITDAEKAAFYDELRKRADALGFVSIGHALDAAQPAMGSEASELAQRFHETYERLAPSFGYSTREASAKPWAEVPENNRQLMTAVCAEILAMTKARENGDGE